MKHFLSPLFLFCFLCFFTSCESTDTPSNDQQVYDVVLGGFSVFDSDIEPMLATKANTVSLNYTQIAVYSKIGGNRVYLENIDISEGDPIRFQLPQGQYDMCIMAHKENHYNIAADNIFPLSYSGHGSIYVFDTLFSDNANTFYKNMELNVPIAVEDTTYRNIYMETMAGKTSVQFLDLVYPADLVKEECLIIVDSIPTRFDLNTGTADHIFYDWKSLMPKKLFVNNKIQNVSFYSLQHPYPYIIVQLAWRQGNNIVYTHRTISNSCNVKKGVHRIFKGYLFTQADFGDINNIYGKEDWKTETVSF